MYPDPPHLTLHLLPTSPRKVTVFLKLMLFKEKGRGILSGKLRLGMKCHRETVTLSPVQWAALCMPTWKGWGSFYGGSYGLWGVVWKRTLLTVMKILCLLYLDKEFSFQHNFPHRNTNCLELTDCNTKCSTLKLFPQVNHIRASSLFRPPPPYKHIHALPHRHK